MGFKNNYEAYVYFKSIFLKSPVNEELIRKIDNIIQKLKDKYNFEYESSVRYIENKLKYNFNKIAIRNEFVEKVNKTKGFSAEKVNDLENIVEPIPQVTSSKGFNK